MSDELLRKVQTTTIKTDRPTPKVGDTVVVHTIIRDGEKRRIQKFQGIVISMKGQGADLMFTVRKISYGVGVEKIFPLHSTNIEKIEILKHASVRRSKLYYMRDRIGKSAMKLKPGQTVEAFVAPEPEASTEEPKDVEEVAEIKAEAQEEVVAEVSESKEEAKVEEKKTDEETK